MDKSEAIRLLGGSVSTAADAIGVTRQAVHKWPDSLPPRIADRVLAALARAGGAVTDRRHEHDLAARIPAEVDRRADLKAAKLRARGE